MLYESWWALCEIQFSYFCLPMIVSCIIMVLSKHKSINGTNYKMLLLNFTCWSVFPGLILAIKKWIWVLDHGAKLTDFLYGVTNLLSVGNVLYALAMVYVFTEYVSRRLEPNKRR